MEVRVRECKSALSASTLPGLRYSLNPYRGCQHNCAYCYGPCVLHMSREQWGAVVEVKQNIPVVLARELQRKEPGVVGVSTVTDAYQPLERSFGLTRACLQELLRLDFPVHVQTKSALVTRDRNLLSRFSEAQVMMSIGTLDDRQRRLLEPVASSIEERLGAMRTLSEAGMDVSVFFGPVYPTVRVEDIPRVLEVFREAGASEVWVDRLNLKPGVWESVEKALAADPEIYKVFQLNVLETKGYYEEIRSAMFSEGEKQGMRIIDAF